MKTDKTNGRLTDPNNPAVEEYHNIGHDIFAIKQALLGLKKNASAPGVIRLTDSLKMREKHLRERRSEKLRTIHIIDQDNKHRNWDTL